MFFSCDTLTLCTLDWVLPKVMLDDDIITAHYILIIPAPKGAILMANIW